MAKPTPKPTPTGDYYGFKDGDILGNIGKFIGELGGKHSKGSQAYKDAEAAKKAALEKKIKAQPGIPKVPTH